MMLLAVWIAVLLAGSSVAGGDTGAVGTSGNTDVAAGDTPTAAEASDVPAEAVLADLPFLEFPEPHRVVVDLAPPGSARPLRFLVDTAASHTIATPRAAKELGIRVRRTKRDPYRRKTLLGRDVQIHVDTRSSDTASKTGWEYAMLGGQFLAEYVVEFDFKARRMRLLDPRRFEVPETAAADDEAIVPLVVRMNRPGVELMLNGIPTLVMVGTAIPPPIMVSGEVADAAGLLPNDLPGFQSHGVLGSTRSELRMLDHLALGKFEFFKIAAVVNSRGWYNQVMPKDSQIGYEFLQQFRRIRIDYSRQRMWLERDSTATLTYRSQTYETLEDLARPPEDTGEPTPAGHLMPIPGPAAMETPSPASAKPTSDN